MFSNKSEPNDLELIEDHRGINGVICGFIFLYFPFFF